MQFTQTWQGSLHLLDWTVAVFIMDILGMSSGAVRTCTHNQQKRKLVCSHRSSTPQQGLISHLNSLSHSVWFY